MGEISVRNYQAKSFLKGWSIPWARIIWLSTAVLVIYLVAGPLLMLIFSSFRNTAQKLPFEATEFTLSNYIHVFGSATTYQLLWNTWVYASGTLCFSLTVTIVFAWLLERTNMPVRALLLTAILAPMAVPGVVEGMAWILLANPSNGIYNVFLRNLFGLSGQGPLNIYSMPGMILVTGLRMVPSMYLMISGTFSRLDPALEEASQMSGVHPRKTFWRISMPLLRPSILAAVIYYFVVSIEVFEIAGLLGMPKRIFVLSTAIYNAVYPAWGVADYGLASGYAMVSFISGNVLIYLYSRSVRYRDRYTVITGKGYRPRLIRLGKVRYVLLGAMLVYSLFAFVIPILSLLWASFLPFYSVPSLKSLSQLSLSNYTRILHNPDIIDATINTGIVATLTPSIVMILATVIAWRAIRRTSWADAIPDRLSFIALGTPSVVIGLALIFVYLSLPNPIYGTIWIIVVAFVTRFITYATRLMGASLIQIHRELEEASYTSGVSWMNTMRRIIFPLVWPSFLRGWIWVSVHSVREVTLALMLVGVGNSTLAVTLWLSFQNKGEIAFASALAILITAVLSIAVFPIMRSTIFQRQVERGM